MAEVTVSDVDETEGTDESIDDQPVLHTEVATDGRHTPATELESVSRSSVPATEGTHSITVPFDLEERETDVEFRGLSGETEGTVEVHEVTVEKRS